MLAEERIEKEVILSREIGAIPPEPVAALCGVDFAQGGSVLRGGEGAGVDLLLEEGTRGAEQIPGAVFFLFANPDVEVAADPGAGMQGGELLLRRMVAQVILNSAAMEAGAVAFDAPVEPAQES